MRHADGTSGFRPCARGYRPVPANRLRHGEFVSSHLRGVSRGEAPFLGLQLRLPLLGLQFPSQPLILLTLPPDVLLALAFGFDALTFLFLFLALFALRLFTLALLSFGLFLLAQLLETLFLQQRVLAALSSTTGSGSGSGSGSGNGNGLVSGVSWTSVACTVSGVNVVGRAKSNATIIDPKMTICSSTAIKTGIKFRLSRITRPPTPESGSYPVDR